MSDEGISFDIKSRLTEIVEKLDVWNLRLRITDLQEVLKHRAAPN
jgi:hypothetical protein